ncbi:hypothetical protein [Streptomyces niveiscabiei]|uniref:Integral membrane protein n=1 Tax=Streptomyces niveiscabiei TaxID=164115 RepID=A0ABW9I0U0_9ACTN
MTVTWQRAEDERWAAVVEARLLLDPRVPDDVPPRVLAEAHEAVTDSGRTATDLFGDPYAYARSVTEDRVDDAHRAARDAHGMTPADRLRTYLATLGAVGVFLGVMAWLDDGFWLHPSWSSLTVFTTVLGVVVLLLLAAVARAAGRRAWGFAAGALAALAAGVTASTLLPEQPAFALPALTLPTAALALSIGAFTLPTPDRWLAPRLRGDDDRWLSHLETLLRTRHAMPRREARAHVEEARRHLQTERHTDQSTPGTSLAEKTFGPADLYALHLTDGPRRRAHQARRTLHTNTALTLVFVLLTVDDLPDADLASPWFWLRAAALAYLVCYTANGWIRVLTGRKPA